MQSRAGQCAPLGKAGPWAARRVGVSPGTGLRWCQHILPGSPSSSIRELTEHLHPSEDRNKVQLHPPPIHSKPAQVKSHMLMGNTLLPQ